MEYGELKQLAWEANWALQTHGLVVLTWGNASVIDSQRRYLAIKPSGIPYDQLRPEDMVVVSVPEGRVIEGRRRPSSDLPTHLELYRAFDGVGSVVHVHAIHATAWAQLATPLVCQGTTHADHFAGDIPVARELTPEEVDEDYEAATGRAIVDTFRRMGLDPLRVPAVLVPGHGPFTWGRSGREAVENAIALECVARMAFLMRTVEGGDRRLPEHVRRKHYDRKHGPHAYYGQEGAR